MTQPKFTHGPWKFEPMDGFDDLHKLKGTTPEPHEGYFRSNGGDWAVGYEDGRVCLVDFKGKAKRGMGYIAPDPEGMANATLIAAAPEMYAALQAMVTDDAFADLCAGIGEEPQWLKDARTALAKAGRA
jgi:hypothetical protein